MAVISNPSPEVWQMLGASSNEAPADPHTEPQDERQPLMEAQELLDLMMARHSARGAFDPDRPLDPDVLHLILRAATWAPTAHNMQNFEFVVVRDKSLLQRLSELQSAASPEFIKENYAQLSFSDDELAAKKTGLLASQFPPEWVSAEAQEGRLAPEPAPLGPQVSDGPVLMVMHYDPSRRAPSSEGDFLGNISLGCVIENMWLMATSLGIGFHIISSLAGEPLVGQVKQLLAIPEGRQVALAIRLGYELEDAQTPRVRRELTDFVSRDNWAPK